MKFGTDQDGYIEINRVLKKGNESRKLEMNLSWKIIRRKKPAKTFADQVVENFASGRFSPLQS